MRKPPSASAASVEDSASPARSSREKSAPPGTHSLAADQSPTGIWRWIPLLVTAIFAAWIVGSCIPPKDTGFAIREFGRLPILNGGRRQPIDSLARNSLLQLRGKQTANFEPWTTSGKIVPATDWLMEVWMNPTLADTRPVFRIDHPDLKGLLGLPSEAGPETDGKHFSFNQLSVKNQALLDEMTRAGSVPQAQRTGFDKAVINLFRTTFLYEQLKVALEPPDAQNWTTELRSFIENRDAGRAAAIAQSNGKDYDKEALDLIIGEVSRFDRMEQLDAFATQPRSPIETRVPLLLPPNSGSADDGWRRSGQALMEAARGGDPSFALAYYARMATAFRSGDTADFNESVAKYRGELAGRFDANLKEAAQEQFFNDLQPFYKAMLVFVCAFLCAIVFWFRPVEWELLRRTAFSLALLGVVVTMVGIIFRMVLVGRPPVINLYSSAVFIAWGAPVLGLLLEKFWRNSIGIVVGSMIAGMSLIIAHYLSLERDTLEMLRAVLDTNFWLATHVVIVTLGYASTFVAGFLGIIFVVRGFFTTAVTPELKRSLARMVYGIVCFATLFSFVGTVLGGIWADQSWGRFWGWDPKENGAIIIVLWNALILHARWGGLVRERGLLNLAIVGNIVTSWSWFGTNLLGIGLHSYGFTDGPFRVLVGFDLAMLLLIGIGCLPEHYWRSFRSAPPRPSQRPPLEPAQPVTTH